MRARPTDLIIGAASGVVATVPMTIAMERLHEVMPGEHEGPLPPREVTENLYDNVRGNTAPASEESLEQATVLLHYAFGGTAGALFPLFAPKRVGAAVGAGILYGVAVWSSSYLGWLPMLGVRHHARHDPPGRTAMMIAAHLVWGATLGLVLSSRPGLQVASRRPDAAKS